MRQPCKQAARRPSKAEQLTSQGRLWRNVLPVPIPIGCFLTVNIGATAFTAVFHNPLPMSASSKSLSNLCLMPRVREEGHYLREMCLFQLTYLSIHLSPSSFANLTLPLVSSSPNPQHLHFLILKVEDYEYTIQCTHFRHIA